MRGPGLRGLYGGPLLFGTRRCRSRGATKESAQSGAPGSKGCPKTRDVLAKFSSFKIKEMVLQKAQALDKVSFQNVECSLYQDVAQATLARRQQFRPITAAVRDCKVRYRWTYPFRIAFTLDNKNYHCTELEETAAVLGIEVPFVTHATDGRRAEATTVTKKTGEALGSTSDRQENKLWVEILCLPSKETWVSHFCQW